MTITIRKLHLAVVVLAVALIAPATAFAAHVFTDVPDGAFYADPDEWAFENEITTGSPAGADTFKPNDPVTRGESVTFLNRYDTNIVQPALTTLAAVQPALTTLAAAQPFAVTALGAESPLTITPTAYVTVSVTAPVAGHVSVNSTAVVSHAIGGGSVLCVVVESTDIPSRIDIKDESAQWFVAADPGGGGTLSGTRTFSIAAGASIDYVLACYELGGNGGHIYGTNLTAIFTPAP
jgi:hypothetical protein